MRMPKLAALVISASALALPSTALPCTNILVARDASADGSTMVTYAADAHDFFGELSFTPARRHKPGAMRQIIEWDSGRPLGQIPEVPSTYKVVGNINEHQLVIAESTFGGREELRDPAGILDYGSLMFIALERAKTAREAIKLIGDLVAEHGYASTGESFSIADTKEVWLMELIGKGPGRKGAVWVAVRLPDGHVTAHANHARIRTFPLDDPERCIYSPDVISFAREKGWFTGSDEAFSFTDAYAPMTWQKLRTCEGRVWSIFRRAAPSLELSSDYIMGKPGAEPLPLSIKPDKKLEPRDVMALMRDHFEGTELDLSRDVGAGPFKLPYRWRPMTWEVDGEKYLHDRAISTQQTGFSFVSQSRGWLADPVGGLLWFGVDDTYSTVYFPVYAGVDRVPRTWEAGRASFKKFSWDSAFWVFNFVSNWAYGRYSDIIVDLQAEQRAIEEGFFASQKALEDKALALYKRNPAAARQLLTRTTVENGDGLTARWRSFGERMIAKYLDGNVRDAEGKVTHPNYPEDWRRRIRDERGDQIRVRQLPSEAGPAKAPAAAPAKAAEPSVGAAP